MTNDNPNKNRVAQWVLSLWFRLFYGRSYTEEQEAIEAAGQRSDEDIVNGSTITDFSADEHDSSQTVVVYEPDNPATFDEGSIESTALTVQTDEREYRFEHSDLEDLKRFFEGLEIRESE